MNLKQYFKQRLMEALIDDPIEPDYAPRPVRPRPIGAHPDSNLPPGYDDPLFNPFDPSTYPIPLPPNQPPFPGPVPTTPNMIRPVGRPIDPSGPPSKPNKPGFYGFPIDFNPFIPQFPTWIPPTVEQPSGPPPRPIAPYPPGSAPSQPAPVPLPSPYPYPPMGPNYYNPLTPSPYPPMGPKAL